MFGMPKLGVTGAAIATVTGQIIAMLMGIIITQKKIKEVQIHFKEFKFHMQMIKDMYRIAIPAILMQSIMSFMTVFMNMILVRFSELAVSAFSIYFKLQQFVFMAVNGMNNALIPIISYNYGAKKQKRIMESIHFSLLIACVIMVVGTMIFQIFPQQLMYLFDAKEEMMSIGVPALRIISLSFIFAGVSLVLSSVFQSVDHANKSLVVTLLRQMVLLLPLVYVLAQQFGLDALWWACWLTPYVICLHTAMRKIPSTMKYHKNIWRMAWKILVRPMLLQA